MNGTKIQVVLTPGEIDHLAEQDLSDATCVVFDVLRATSAIVTAIAHGANEVYPVTTIEEAHATRQRLGSHDVLLGGERHGNRIEGFDVGNSPAEYTRLPQGSRIVTTTTNGTIALRACDGAKRVLLGALLNLDAVADSIADEIPERLLIVCAGTFRNMALEDVLAAGALISRLPDWRLDDAGQLALAFYQTVGANMIKALRQSENGRALIAAGRETDVQWCSDLSRFPVVPQMRQGIIRGK